MKYGSVDLGRFDKLFSPADKTYFQKFIDTKNLLKENNTFWKSHFIKDAMPTATAATGDATFKVAAVEKAINPMADFVTPFSDNPQVDKDGWRFYVGTIPDLGKGYMETAQERWQKELMFKEFGNDTDIIMQYTNTIQGLYDGVNARLSNMSAQLLSKGQIGVATGTGRGQGLGYMCKADIPTANFITSGAKIWTAADCNIPKQMAEIEEDMRTITGYQGAWEWLIQDSFIKEYMLTNQYVQKMVLNYYAGKQLTFNSEFIVTYEMFNEAIVNQYSPISPIRPIYEKQVEQTLTTRTQVSGWDSDIAVLKPVGYAGVVKYTSIPEILVSNSYNTSAVQKTIAMLEMGMFGLINYVKDNGGYGEWHTDIRASVVPALTEFPYHVIVDMTTADS
jgi:hypothetical protein